MGLRITSNLVTVLEGKKGEKGEGGQEKEGVRPILILLEDRQRWRNISPEERFKILIEKVV